MSTVLSVRGLSVRFGGLMALDGVDFGVEEGTITSLIGPNGAGKTTLFNAVSGFVPVSGAIELSGRDLTCLAPHARSRAGVVRTFQNLEIFANMSCLENVMTGAGRLSGYGVLAALFKTPRFWREERAAVARAEEALAFVGLAEHAATPAGDLAFGNQRLLELARALAARPTLLLLDETAAGLNMRETKALGGLITRIRDELGISVALVEHDMDLVMGISDHITVLTFGQVLARGRPREIQQNPEVIRAYLGEDE